MMTLYDDVMRTIIELTNQQIADLDAWRSVRGISRAEAIRRAIRAMLDSDDARRSGLEATQGLWSEHLENGLEHQERLREEWEPR